MNPRYGLHFRGGLPAFYAGELKAGVRVSELATLPVSEKSVAAQQAKRRETRRRLEALNIEREYCSHCNF